MADFERFEINGTTPAAAGTAVGGAVHGLDRFDDFTIDAALVGATDGALDVYLQRKIGDDAWADWAHFPQLSAGGAAVRYSLHSGGAGNTLVVVGQGTDATPGVALAANTFVGGHPGSAVRAVYVAGASTSAGAAVKIRITARKRA